MSDPRRLSTLDYQRAALNHHVRSSHRPGKQPEQGPVAMECDLHLTFEAPTELRGRDQAMRLMEALLKMGYSVTLTGDRVVPAAEPGPRSVQ